MLKTRTRFRRKDQTMSQSMEPKSNQIGHNTNTKTITIPLALSLLMGLNKNNKYISDSDFDGSPKSPLEFKMFSTMAESFFFRSPKSSLLSHLNCCCGSAKVGLSIVESLGNDQILSPDVVFGPALRIKSSDIKDKHHKLFSEPKSLKIDKVKSSVVFEICDENSSETVNDCLRKTQVLSRSNFPGIGSDKTFSSSLSDDEIEMSEDYTCIIAHGPNPKTIHIYGDKVLECHKNELKEEDDDNFLSICNLCNKKLEVGEDVYIYRGEKAFCSEECRLEEMVIDEDEDIDDSSLIIMHESLKKKLL